MVTPTPSADPVEPTIGVVIAAYNAERFLDAALSSVAHQTRAPDQVVVVDDGSTDATARIALDWTDRLPLRVISNDTNIGLGATRRRGVEHLDTDWVAVLDADDIWMPDHLALTRESLGPMRIVSPLYQVLHEGGDLGPVFGPARRRARARRSSDQLRLLLRGNFLVAGSTFPRSLYDSVGGYPTTRFAEDYELWLMMVLRGARVEFLEAPTVLYRVHGGSVTTDESRPEVAIELNELSRMAPPELRPRIEFACRVATAQRRLARERHQRYRSRLEQARYLSPVLRRAPMRQKISAAVRLVRPLPRTR